MLDISFFNSHNEFTLNYSKAASQYYSQLLLLTTVCSLVLLEKIFVECRVITNEITYTTTLFIIFNWLLHSDGHWIYPNSIIQPFNSYMDQKSDHTSVSMTSNSKLNNISSRVCPPCVFLLV